MENSKLNEYRQSAIDAAVFDEIELYRDALPFERANYEIMKEERQNVINGIARLGFHLAFNDYSDKGEIILLNSERVAISATYYAKPDRLLETEAQAWLQMAQIVTGIFMSRNPQIARGLQEGRSVESMFPGFRGPK